MVGSILAVTAVTYGLGKLLMGGRVRRLELAHLHGRGPVAHGAVQLRLRQRGELRRAPALWALNGFIQGMGWPPCGRSLGHWFSVRERGTVFAFWNIAHNVGGGVAGVVAANAARTSAGATRSTCPGCWR